MSEVVISRRGGKKSKGYLMTEYIESNREWVVPEGVVNNEFNVRIFSGGSGFLYSNLWGFSASGAMNNAVLKLTPGESINITVGKGAFYVDSRNHTERGGSTSFGLYLSANGNGSSGYVCKYSSPSNLQFGSGGCIPQSGVWGGTGGSNDIGGNFGGATSGYYGGGGGGVFTVITRTDTLRCNPTNGGYYGGGGGGAFVLTDYWTTAYNSYWVRGANGGVYNDNGTWKQSGLAGNGGDKNVPSTNGTNTESLNIKDGMGYSLTGNGSKSQQDGYFSTTNYKPYETVSMAGGGYGGIAGRIGSGFDSAEDSIVSNRQKELIVVGAGGGGYGSNGGNGDWRMAPQFNAYRNWLDVKGGGGGGYGGDGEDGGYGDLCGAGGGYGKVSKGKSGGGGGYYCPGGGANSWSGAAGGIGIWHNNKLIKSYACGTGISNYNAEPGVCIIQYYLKVD